MREIAGYRIRFRANKTQISRIPIDPELEEGGGGGEGDGGE